ncbi:TPA: VanZ family protein [Neisseria weaveri]
MMLPRNRFMLMAVLWFAAGIYFLIFRESDSSNPPPFLHFDKFAHFALFFAQFWLLAKAFFSDGLTIPYGKLMITALCYAVVSETAQAWLTATREGSLLDGAADLAGAATALWTAAKVVAAKST